MDGLIHISIAKIDFKCPYCGKSYRDDDDKYLNRIQGRKGKRHQGYTKIRCVCGDRFGMTYDIKGDAVSFEL